MKAHTPPTEAHIHIHRSTVRGCHERAAAAAVLLCCCVADNIDAIKTGILVMMLHSGMERAAVWSLLCGSCTV